MAQKLLCELLELLPSIVIGTATPAHQLLLFYVIAECATLLRRHLVLSRNLLDLPDAAAMSITPAAASIAAARIQGGHENADTCSHIGGALHDHGCGGSHDASTSSHASNTNGSAHSRGSCTRAANDQRAAADLPTRAREYLRNAPCSLAEAIAHAEVARQILCDAGHLSPDPERETTGCSASQASRAKTENELPCF
jgi:hypothetical protein